MRFLLNFKKQSGEVICTKDKEYIPALFIATVSLMLESRILHSWKLDILNLALVSKSLLKLVIPYVSNFKFWQIKKKGHTFKYYSPKIYCNASSLQVIPPRVTHLSFSELYNKPITSPLPSSLVHLRLGKGFNSPIADGVLPHGLKLLLFGNKFDYPLVSLPSTITHLRFGTSFNQPIAAILPPGLTHLAFDCYNKLAQNWELNNDGLRDLCSCREEFTRQKAKFNQPIGTLPVSLVYLAFGHAFSHPLLIPRNSNISFLRIASDYVHHIPYDHLQKLTKLAICRSASHAFTTPRKLISPSLKTLVWDSRSVDLRSCTSLTNLSIRVPVKPHRLPPNLTHASFVSWETNPATFNASIAFLSTLTKVTHLVLTIHNCAPKLVAGVNLPPNLTHLQIFSYPMHSIHVEPTIYSPTLKHLVLDINCSDMQLSVPHLTHFSLYKSSNRKIGDKIPPSATHVAFGPTFDPLLSKSPASITNLKIGPSLSSSHPVLPHNLEHLTLCSPIHLSVLPPTLKTLHVPRDCLEQCQKSRMLAGVKVIETNLYDERYEEHHFEQRDWPVNTNIYFPAVREDAV